MRNNVKPRVYILNKLSVLLSFLILFSIKSQAEVPVVAQTLNSDNQSKMWSEYITLRLVDEKDGKPIEGVTVVCDETVLSSDRSGKVELHVKNKYQKMTVLKAGYRKVIVQPHQHDVLISMQSVEIKSIYMQTGHVKRKTTIYNNALSVLQASELNSIVIDFKDDEGRVSSNLKPYIDELHAQGVYAIARIVAFKDNVTPRARPDIALINKSTGRPWEDKNKVTYLDPFNEASWDYLARLADKAAGEGFDEIQFDYVRFPTDGDRSSILWKTKNFNSDSRTAAISGMLARVKNNLNLKGVFLAADVFGITAFDKNDSGIGQKIEEITAYLDYVCPMVYPSGYARNTSGIASPVADPQKIVYESVRRYRLRADPDTVIRPWLQAFRDYSFDHRSYGGKEIRAQINGSDEANGKGFLLWNASSKYTLSGLKLKGNSVTVGNKP